MLAGKLLADPVDGLLDPERLAAADAVERQGLVEHLRAAQAVGEVETGFQGNHALGAGDLAEATLHAGLFIEAEPGPLLLVQQSVGRAGGNAGQAERAAAGIDLDRAEGGAFRQRQELHRVRRVAMQLVECQAHLAALSADWKEAAEGHGAAIGQAVELTFHGVRVLVFDDLQPATAVAQTLQYRLQQSKLAGKATELTRLVRPDQHDQLACAIGEGAGQEVEADLGHFVDREGQYARRQAVPAPRHQGDHFLAVALVVDQ